MKYSREELKDILRELLLENIDKISANVAKRLKAQRMDKSKFVREQHRLVFVKKYTTLCSEAYKEGPEYIFHKHAKKPAGRALVALARTELNYKPSTYSGDIYRLIGITYFKHIGKWPYK